MWVVLSNMVAYYGTYDVDESTGTIVHHIEGAVDRAWIGQSVRRQYAFDGDLLTLTIKESAHDVRTVYRRLSR
jgi:hypothetical protein